MARSKNRRKKPARPKKSKSKTKKRSPSQDADADQALLDEEPSEETVLSDSRSSGGLLIGMRNMISGGGQANEGFFSKRRSFGEWSLWFAGLLAIYYAVQYYLEK